MKATTVVEAAESGPLLRVRDLRASFPSSERGSRRTATHEILHGIDLEVRRGETLAIVGESGSGKSVTALSILGLLSDVGGTITAGTATFGDIDLVGATDEEFRRLRGADIGVVFQDPLTSLNPIHKIGNQLTEVMKIHSADHRSWRGSRSGAPGDEPVVESFRERALQLLDRVGLPQPAMQFERYPHQLSGGMRQRVMIAMALANNPRLLVLDEPTTALDVTTQAQILDLLRSIKEELKCTVVLITHDFGVVAELADRVAVMFRGEIVESGTAEETFRAPKHAYTKSLLASHASQPERAGGHAVASAGAEDARVTMLDVENLVTEYRATVGGRTRRFRAVDGVSISVRRGQTIGVVGESGCGKSSLVRTIMRLIDPLSGEIVLAGKDITRLKGSRLRARRRDIQLVFQDPSSSLDPRMSVSRIIAEPMIVHKTCSRAERPARIRELLELVGLDGDAAHRFPHQFSGGQRQRIGIARALAALPQVLLLDEAVSALDPTVQAQIVALLARLQRELGLAYVFISHDLSVVREVSDQVAVMYLGQVIEIGDVRSIFEKPSHPYTQALLSAVPISDPSQRGSKNRILLAGDLPSPFDPPSGCRFRTRCWKAQEICASEAPELIDRPGIGHPSACHFPDSETAFGIPPVNSTATT